jgi:predicted RNA binding protein YcfA (HicA-like mRNA interferase family)
VRRRGSHVVMQRRGEAGTRTVPVPDHPELRVGTLRSIIRQSGVPRAAFEA